MRRSAAIASPEQLSEASEAACAARSALTELPLEEREAVSLCCEQDMTRKVAAEVLEIPETTLTSRVQRGLEKLRLRLAAQGFAAMTPLAIGEGLRGLGVPPAPSGLMRAVGELARGAARKSVHGAGKTAAAKSTTAANAGMKVVAGVVLASAVATAVMVASNGSPPASVAPNQPVAPAVTPAPVPPAPGSPDATVLAKFDFEDGSTLPEWVGKIETGPPRPGNRNCLAGQYIPEMNLTRTQVGDNDKGLFTYRDGAVLTFDYWVGAKVEDLRVYLWDRTQQASAGDFKLLPPSLVKEKWNRATVRLSDLHFGAAGKLHNGDLVIDLTIQTGEGGGALYVDNVEVAAPRAPGVK